MDLYRRFSTNPTSWHEWVFEHLDLAGPSRILELGCGSGELWLVNRNRIPIDWNVLLSDLSPGMIATSRERLNSLDHQFSFATIDAHCIPFDAETFDAVIANHMMHHLDQPQEVLVEIKRVLKSSGSLYMATNGRRHLAQLKMLEAGQHDGSGLWIDVAASADAFRLENGADELSRHFEKISRLMYQNTLIVTEPAALLGYARSRRPEMPSETAQRLMRTATSVLIEKGSIRIETQTGMFIARAKRSGMATMAHSVE